MASEATRRQNREEEQSRTVEHSRTDIQSLLSGISNMSFAHLYLLTNQFFYEN